MTPGMAPGVAAETISPPAIENAVVPREQLTAGTSSFDSDDDSDTGGPRPADLYGRFTWKIETFSEISKRELRSNIFEVGGHKWYILVYPQGCDVCNHLSLFLCTADYDKLLPGWNHFAQFTIAVVNRDPKKSKYSDTLHRFCKKEHDWGWKKFMELSKIRDGFTLADTLVIKAQVQVIKENPNRPFRCLEWQYRQELTQVYLSNVEAICRRFVEEKREKLGKLLQDSHKWASMRAFWMELDEEMRAQLVREKCDTILRGLLLRFANDKEVTSPLVLDALYSGSKALQGNSGSLVRWEGDAFVLQGDALVLVERAAGQTLPAYHYKAEDKQAFHRAKEAGAGAGAGVQREECWMTLLGRLCCEVAVVTHLFTTRVEVAYREALSLLRQEELLREVDREAAMETAERTKRSKKKQAKMRKKEAAQRERQRQGGGARGEEEGEAEEEERQEAEAGGGGETPSASTSDDPQLLAPPHTLRDTGGHLPEASERINGGASGEADACIAELRQRVEWLEGQLEEKTAEVLQLRMEVASWEERQEDPPGMPHETGAHTVDETHPPLINGTDGLTRRVSNAPAPPPRINSEQNSHPPSLFRGSEASGGTEDFPHLALINDLLDEDQLGGSVVSLPAAFSILETKVRRSSLRGDAPPFEIRERREPQIWKGN